MNMKRVVQIVLMGIWCAFFLNGEQLKQDKWNVTIEGKILHPVTSIVRIVGPDVNLQTRLDSEGKFKVKAFIKVAGYYKFINKENAPLYLKPGDRLNLTLDSRQFDETLSYRGSGADINNYLIRKYLVMEQRFYNRERDVFSMKKAGFISRIESIFSQIHLLLTKLEPSKADRNSGFMELEKKMLFLEKAELYFVYPKEYRKNTRKDGENMDAVFAELIKQIDTNDSTQLSQAKYREVLKLILDKKTRDRFGKDASSQQFTDEFAKMKSKVRQMVWPKLREDIGPAFDEIVEFVEKKDM